MAYNKQTWVDKNSSYPVSAARMGVIEQGIFNAAQVADQGHQIITTAQKTALGTVTTGTQVYDSTLGQHQTYNGTAWVPASGLVLVKADSFTAQGSVTYDSIFPTTYDHYRLYIRHVSSINSAALKLTWRAAAADQATAYYQGSHTVSYLGAASATWNNKNNATETVIANLSNQYFGITAMDFSVNNVRSQWVGTAYDSYATSYAIFGGERAANGRADGLKLAPSSGTLTATVLIYAYTGA